MQADPSADYRLLEPGTEYDQLIITGLEKSIALCSLVCNGALPMRIDRESTPDESLLGRALFKSYITSSFNAASISYPDEKKVIEHCMFKTTGKVGLVMDFDHRVWPEDSAGSFFSVLTGRDKLESVVRTTDQVLANVNEARAVHRAFLDVLLVPLVQNWAGSDLSSEAIMYVYFTLVELSASMQDEDYAVLMKGMQAITALDDNFAANLFAVIMVEIGMPVPKFLPSQGVARSYVDMLLSVGWQDTLKLECYRYKFWIELVADMSRCGLLAATFLDIHLLWGGSDDVLDSFADLLDGNESIPQPIDPLQVPHRAVTTETVNGVQPLRDEMEVPYGKLRPPEHGEINTRDLSGRMVGSIDGRRVVAYFREGHIVVQFKNARNYFHNFLYFIRPGMFVQTNVREDVIDRDQLIGLPALHLLLRGRTSPSLARFTIAALKFKSMSIQPHCNSGLLALLGSEEQGDGAYWFRDAVSPSILLEFPVLCDANNRLYVYYEGETYRLKVRAMAWRLWREKMIEDAVGYGQLTTSLPLKEGV